MKMKTFWAVIIPTAIVAITAILLSMFWPAISGTIKGNSYYTGQDVQDSYDKGYKDGNKNETELNAKISYYETIVDDYTKSITQLNAEIANLNKSNANYQTQISNIESQKANLQTQVENLTTIKSNNETTIASLNSQITSLQNQVTNLTNSNEDSSEQIIILNNQITTLQNTVSQLQTTNDMNITTITSLNTQIASLNTQISDMTLQSQNSQSQINALNNKINELQASVSYYESYIAQLENGEQVVATFEFGGSVYNIQIVNKGSKLSVTTPTSTTYKIFNGWTINGSAIDLSTYTITANTKIVADVTYKYDVKFKVDDTVYDSQIITKNSCATLPTNPTKVGYEFDGWSMNGVDIISDITSKQVLANTTYIAVFTKLHTVTFMYENAIKSTQTIRNGGYATDITIESTTDKIFNGWKVNGSKIDLSTYKIVTGTTFVADITYKYSVTFNGTTTIVDGGSSINAPSLTEYTATKYGNVCKDKPKGWSLDNYNIIDFTTFRVNSDCNFSQINVCSLAGIYEGVIGGSYTIKLYISDMAVCYCETDYPSLVSEVSNNGAVCNDFTNCNTYDYMYSISCPYWGFNFNKNEDGSLSLLSPYSGTSLTRVGDLPQMCIWGEYGQYTFNGYTFIDNSLDSTSSYRKKDYTICNNKILYRASSGLVIAYGSIDSFVMTDTYIKIGDTVYNKYIGQTYVKMTDYDTYHIDTLTGEIVSDTTCLSMEEMKTIDGLSISLLNNAPISYKVAFYDKNQSFISITNSLTDNFDTSTIPSNAQYFRIEVKNTDGKDYSSGFGLGWYKSDYVNSTKLLVVYDV